MVFLEDASLLAGYAYQTQTAGWGWNRIIKAKEDGAGFPKNFLVMVLMKDTTASDSAFHWIDATEGYAVTGTYSTFLVIKIRKDNSAPQSQLGWYMSGNALVSINGEAPIHMQISKPCRDCPIASQENSIEAGTWEIDGMAGGDAIVIPFGEDDSMIELRVLVLPMSSFSIWQAPFVPTTE